MTPTMTKALSPPASRRFDELLSALERDVKANREFGTPIPPPNNGAAQ